MFYLGDIKLMAYLIGAGLILVEFIPVIVTAWSNKKRNDYK